MEKNHLKKIAKNTSIAENQISAVAQLLEEGATVPFIARYRKEATGCLDEVAIMAIRDGLEKLVQLDERRASIVKSLEERNLLSDELKASVMNAEDMTTLEDIYLPYKPKRRTRAMIAREKGLEPLANLIMLQNFSGDIQQEIQKYISAEKGVETAEDAVAGARDIIAETVNEDIDNRQTIRKLFSEKALLTSSGVKGKEEEGAKYRDYFKSEELIIKTSGHRLLAMFRGENEGFLKLSINPQEDEAIQLLKNRYLGRSGSSIQIKVSSQKASDAANSVFLREQISLAVEDSYKRLLAPSMENEIRQELKERADEEAIRVFADNLREVLMESPLGGKAMMAVDPGFRTGCKTVCLDSQGKLLFNTAIFIGQSDAKQNEAALLIPSLIKRFDLKAIAIGNGTASRETEEFFNSLNLEIPIIMVNESGASIYSASEVARNEFPDQDITVRGAVSIGRRLMDPLAELVKIDPKSIGVGQYQHDVNQTLLRKCLDDVVANCVNQVGVNVNTASGELLTYVSGLGNQLAKNVVTWRNENGPFKSRSELKKVPRLGPKAFEQSAGFLRVPEAKNPLDSSAVHPESYKVVEKMAEDLNCSVLDLIKNEEMRKKIKLEKYVTDKIGLPTLQDIMSELAKPGRDPRKSFEVFSFDNSVKKIDDLKPGQKLPGIVTNVTKFGAFVDIGVHQDGLVHVSELADRFIKDPGEIVKPRQKVKVTVLEVDTQRKRIALSLKR
ncbi:MAG: RNA-binding transcriptional accessory protein [Candidatus Riflebacteria bacterium]|nr:RNA-binding transcriptional accessory protein [Candidatus Riflebacteria bacterium]